MYTCPTTGSSGGYNLELKADRPHLRDYPDFNDITLPSKDTQTDSLDW